MPNTGIGQPWVFWLQFNTSLRNGQAEASRKDHYKQPQEPRAMDHVQVRVQVRPAGRESGKSDIQPGPHGALCYCGRKLVPMTQFGPSVCVFYMG